MNDRELAIKVCSGREGKIIGIVSNIGNLKDFTVEQIACEFKGFELNEIVIFLP
jgi:hypothetical protein